MFVSEQAQGGGDLERALPIRYALTHSTKVISQFVPLRELQTPGIDWVERQRFYFETATF